MRSLHHVGYWVDDLDSALKQWGQDLDVGPFDIIPHMTFDSFVLTVDGQQYRDVHAIDDRLAAAYGSGAGGPAGVVSHVSWVVPDVEQESTRLARLGCRLINTARTGPISVAWHDGGPLFPHPIEVHQHNDVIAGMHDRLTALRADEN